MYIFLERRILLGLKSVFSPKSRFSYCGTACAFSSHLVQSFFSPSLPLFNVLLSQLVCMDLSFVYKKDMVDLQIHHLKRIEGQTRWERILKSRYAGLYMKTHVFSSFPFEFSVLNLGKEKPASCMAWGIKKVVLVLESEAEHAVKWIMLPFSPLRTDTLE